MSASRHLGVERVTEPDYAHEREVLEVGFDATSFSEFEKRMYDMVASAIERAKVGAQTVQAASAAIVTLYAGLLGLVFSADGEALPLRSLIAPIFLAAAVVLSTAYLSFIRPDSTSIQVPGLGTWRVQALERIEAFASYVRTLVNKRGWALRAGLLSLGVGVVTLILPFVSDGTFDGSSGGQPADLDALTVDPQLPAAVAAVVMKAKIDQAIVAAGAGSHVSGFWDEPAFALGIFLAGVVIVVIGTLVSGGNGKQD